MEESKIDLRDQKNFLEQCRRNNPVFQVSDNYWVISSYNEVKEAMRSSSLVRQMKESYDDTYIHSLLNLDGDDHAKYRKILNPFFSNSSINEIQKNIENNVNKKFSAIKSKEEINLISDIAFPIPFYSICQILGVDISEEEDYSFIADWTTDAMLVLNMYLSKEDYKKHSIGTEKVFTYIVNMLYGKKFRKTSNGVFSYLKNYTDGGEFLKNEEIISLCLMLFIGGFETNLNTFTSLVYEFVNNKNTADMVLNDIDNKNTIEELFRHSSSLNFITRRASSDLSIGNQTIKEGQYAILHIASANRDSKIFSNPHIIDPKRKNAASHLAFGGGAHYCIGASLSRSQIKTITKEFLTNMSKQCGFVQEPKKNTNTSMNGYREMVLSHYYN